MESTRTIRKPRAAAAKSKFLFFIFFIGCYNIYSQTNRLNGVNTTKDPHATSSTSSIVQEAMLLTATPALKVPIPKTSIPKTSSTAEHAGGEQGDIKKIIFPEHHQEQLSTEESHKGNNVIKNDGAATSNTITSSTTSTSAAVGQEQDNTKPPLLADNDTNSSIATSTTDTSTTSNSSTAIRPPLVEESANKRNKKFISYELVKDLPLRAVYDIKENEELSCHDESGLLPEPFQAPGLLDFSTLIDTNLNILYVGDSVGVQFAQILQEATHPIKRETIRYAWKAPFESSHIALTPSGGTVAGTRVTGLMTNRTRNVREWLPNSAGGGWLTRDIREMKRLNRHWRPTENVAGKFGRGRSPCEEGEVEGAENATFPSKEEYPCEEQDFDVVVHQFAPGWQPNFVKDISWSAIDEMVNLSFDYLGANTVVLQTIQIMNNVDNLAQLLEVNSVIWKYARDFQTKEAQRKSKDGRKRRVVVMDLYAYTVSLVLQNSMAIGLVSNDRGATLQRQLQESNDFDTYLNLTMSLDDIYQHRTQIYFKIKGRGMFKKQSHICADANCDKKSRITADGMHWCTKVTGGRINAALACLLRCSFEEEKEDRSIEEMKQCEWRCNKQYMSLAPIHWDDAEEINVKLKMVDLQNKEITIQQNNLVALPNY